MSGEVTWEQVDEGSSGCASTCVSLGPRSEGGSAVGPGESWPGPGWEGGACTHAYIHPQSVPATGIGLQPRGLAHPGTSNWRDWDPGTAAEKTE